MIRFAAFLAVVLGLLVLGAAKAPPPSNYPWSASRTFACTEEWVCIYLPSERYGSQFLCETAERARMEQLSLNRRLFARIECVKEYET